MHIDRQAQKPGQGFTLRRRGALALFAALLLAMPLAHSARAQSAGAPNQTSPTIVGPNNQPAGLAAPPTQTNQMVTPGGGAANAVAPPTEPSATNEGASDLQGTLNKPSVAQLSLVRMFLDTDPLVKAVMIGLALASLVTWTIFVAKTLELRRVRLEAREGLRILLNAASLAQAFDQLRESATAVAQLMAEAAQEIRLSGTACGDGLKERVALQLERAEMATSRKIARGTGVLATIGSTAVFVGLFGTVWGIMNSFIGISNAHTTNLAVVAPGIAQALLATAMGLIAAIPAVVIYNVLTRQTAHYRAMLGDASAQIMRLVSRDLDRAKLPLAQAAE